MRAPGRLALLLVATTILAACGDTGQAPAPSAPAATPTIPPTAIDAQAPGTPPADTPVIRSLRLSGSGWQFDLDTATVGDATRIEVLVRPYQRVRAGEALYRIVSPQWHQLQQALPSPSWIASLLTQVPSSAPPLPCPFPACPWTHSQRRG